ncbi:hypothetical protein F5879DRAFT_992363 [Lentinula edodes]|uniref:Uncharacterized protein n=1 Tax=Lentinula edodes TaxID=5353 RepID=A0A1Q3ECH2_LENED|nr:hypothetical protein F5879DRAFT_992363 [Lentinula edodes]GAW04906.1 hypothetical protein LENED_006725 [Lentinula edodes]
MPPKLPTALTAAKGPKASTGRTKRNASAESPELPDPKRKVPLHGPVDIDSSIPGAPTEAGTTAPSATVNPPSRESSVLTELGECGHLELSALVSHNENRTLPGTDTSTNFTAKLENVGDVNTSSGTMKSDEVGVLNDGSRKTDPGRPKVLLPGDGVENLPKEEEDVIPPPDDDPDDQVLSVLPDTLTKDHKPESPREVGVTVLDITLQHPSLVDHYNSLCWVPEPATMVPYATAVAQACEVSTADLTLVAANFSPNATARVKKGIKFIRYKNVISLTKAPSNCLSHGSDGHAYVADLNSPRRELAVLIATGVCVGSHLQQPIGAPGFKAKKIFVKLFTQEYELFESRLGSYFGCTTFYGPMEYGNITFQTKKESQAGNSGYGSGSPTKGKTSKFTVTSPRKPAMATMASALAVKNLPVASFLDWNSPVPIFDGRGRSKTNYNGFAFSPEDWDSLTSLPRYSSEIPDDALVSVGFSLAGPWSMADLPTGHFYVLFAILLAVADR